MEDRYWGGGKFFRAGAELYILFVLLLPGESGRIVPRTTWAERRLDQWFHPGKSPELLD